MVLEKFVSNAVQMLDKLAEFSDKWDGHRAPKFDRRTLDVVRGFVQEAAGKFRASKSAVNDFYVVPNTDGYLNLLLVCGLKAVTIECSEDGKSIEIMYGINGIGGDFSEDKYDVHGFSFERVLDWLVGIPPSVDGLGEDG